MIEHLTPVIALPFYSSTTTVAVRMEAQRRATRKMSPLPFV